MKLDKDVFDLALRAFGKALGIAPLQSGLQFSNVPGRIVAYRIVGPELDLLRTINASSGVAPCPLEF